MKKIVMTILLCILCLSLVACGSGQGNSTDTPQTSETAQASQESEEPRNQAEESSDSTGDENETPEPGLRDSEGTNRILVAYFSATGNTEAVAEHTATAMKADIYEIIPEEPYTSADLDYSDSNSRSTKEMDDPATRPGISGSVDNMDNYNIVFIGYPIWWGEAPRIISTFLESYDFSGKTIVTFSTSGGSGHNDRNIQSLADDAAWITGARLSSGASRSDVAAWINGLDLDIAAE